MNHIHFDTIDSTNTEARKIISRGDYGGLPLLITAGSQTAGRGRTGHTFYSPGKTGVYMTLVTEADFGTLKKSVYPTTVAGVAVRRVLCRYLDDTSELKIKWVNDLYFRGKKVCGILTESFTFNDTTYVLLGVGINMSTEDFPADIADTAGNLGITHIDSSRIAEEVAEEYLSIVSTGLDSYMDEYRAHSLVSGKSIRFLLNGRETSGIDAAINNDGSLTVKTEDGETLTLSGGEIFF